MMGGEWWWLWREMIHNVVAYFDDHGIPVVRKESKPVENLIPMESQSRVAQSSMILLLSII